MSTITLSELDCTINSGVKNTISNAGSDRLATSISRRAPMLPNEVPMSIAASAENTRASANTPTSAITSAAGANNRLVSMIGTTLAASTMQPN